MTTSLDTCARDLTDTASKIMQAIHIEMRRGGAAELSISNLGRWDLPGTIQSHLSDLAEPGDRTLPSV